MLKQDKLENRGRGVCAMWTFRCSECYNMTAHQQNWPKKDHNEDCPVKNDEAESNDDEVGPSDVASILDIATFMKQPFS